jgi:cation diffusion facilitator CzcD-associated flavoprotein CzcO
MAMGLRELENRLREDLSRLRYPERGWVRPHASRSGEPVLDVLIVGAGQGGLAIGAALGRERVTNLRIVDANEPDRAGPWLTFARMVTLRTPKYLTGMDLGIPNLTIQSWYEAQYGPGSWDSLGLIPKGMWAEYLAWYRRIFELPVQANTRVEDIAWVPPEACFRVKTTGPSGPETLWARYVVLATGIDGSGGWFVPSFVRGCLAPHQYAHTRDHIDFDRLRGRRVAVLGAGASAFDNAACALEAGASRVDLFFRRPKLVDINAYRWVEFVGFLKHYADLSDADKWRFMRQILRMGQLPPADTLARAKSHPNFHLHPRSPWESLHAVGDHFRIDTPTGSFEADFAILGTGFRTDLGSRPELGNIAPHIALWSDRFAPPQGDGHDELSRHPYLGTNFQFVEKSPGQAPWVERVFNYTFGCLLSVGLGGASISGLKYSIPRVVDGLTRALFLEDRDEYFESLRTYDQREF